MASADELCTVEVSPRTGAKHDAFQMQIVVSSNSDQVTPEIVPDPSFEIADSGTQSRTQIINGRVSSETIFTYSLQPLTTGSLLSPKVICRTSSGTSYEPARVKVVINRGVPKLFLRQSVNKLSAYEGEQLRHSLEILYRVKVNDINVSKPSASGAWFEELYEGPKKAVDVGGTEYHVYAVDRALYPLQAGQFELEPQSASARVKERTKVNQGNLSIFDIDPFGFGSMGFTTTRLRQISVRSNPIEIEVKPLPRTLPAKEFWGAAIPIVGDSSLEIEIDRSPLKMGDSRTLTVTLSSLGTINGINSLPSEFLSSNDFTAYQENPVNSVDNSGKLLVQKKVFKASVVPTNGSELVIPSLSISYFDLSAQEFKTLATDEIRLPLLGARIAAPNSEQNSVDSAARNEQAEEKFYEPTAFQKFAKTISTSVALLLIFCLLLVVGIGILLVYLARRGQSQRRLLSKLSRTKNLLDVRAILFSFIEAKTGHSVLHLPVSEIHHFLEQHKLPDDLVSEIRFCLLDIDRLLFSGSNTTTEDLERIKKQVSSAVVQWDMIGGT